MGQPAASREGSDKERPVLVRKQGSAKSGYPTFGLIIPAWLAREITGSDDAEEMWQYLRQFEFFPEMRADGILYKPTRLTRKPGWVQ